MKVFDLRCDSDHRFEGWFGSDVDYTAQLGKQMIACPVCGSLAIDKLPSAPRLNLSGASAPPETAASNAPSAPSRTAPAAANDAAPASGATAEVLQELERRYLAFAREVIAKTENVGDRFAEEARKIHYEEAPARGIRGVATPEQRRELQEEGIDVVSMPIPAALDGPLQ
ncbi:DUF1178 family protein [Pararobbsia silviterrae]|uniref:DUF1178 family protein n=1 Tax=Pararobbsia silviterrae TaxID=1792498 RepID=A0A494Y5V4_9BURK|nr:DUF1178 family protein [Pararobbsia silviterrae]RKP57472.1 DUF1178 family protein [Pararobbsia silviterrae]